MLHRGRPEPKWITGPMRYRPRSLTLVFTPHKRRVALIYIVEFIPGARQVRKFVLVSCSIALKDVLVKLYVSELRTNSSGFGLLWFVRTPIFPV